MPIIPPNNSVGGQIWSWMNIDAGPSIGWVRRPLFNDKYITTGTTYSIQPFDWRLLISRAATSFEVFLPSVVTWMRQPYGLFPLQVKDVGNPTGADLTATPITVSPNGTDTIDGLDPGTYPVQILTGGGSLTLEPKSDLSGWNLLP